jgi:hypothetical protein
MTDERWRGFVVSAAPASGVDPTALFLSRAAFDATVTPENSLRDLLDHIAGEEVADRVLKGFLAIEEVADGVDLRKIIPAAADPEVFQRHAASTKAIEWWAKLRAANLEAMNEMYRANTRAREGGREFTLYYARKFEFGFETLNALEGMRQAALAKEAQDEEKQTEHLEKAIESMYGALNAHAAIARDQSDRGVIALMNAYAYRLLQKQLEEADAK